MANYSVVLCQRLAREFKNFLRDRSIRFYPSGCGEDCYFSIECSPESAEIINQWLDSH